MSYCLKEALISIYRNSWLSLASIGTIFISLVILGFSLLFIYNANDLSKNVEEEMEIQVFLLDSMTDEETEAMRQELEQQPHIIDIDFTSKEQAMKNFREQLGNNQALVSGLEGIDNPLPRSFTLKVDESRMVAETAKLAEEMQGVETVSYGQGTVEKVVNIIYWFRIVGLIIIVVLAIAALLLISTAIRLSVYARRREIEIMKFLGAYNWFVSLPFFLEGMILGLIGAVLGAVVVYFVYISGAEALNSALMLSALKTDWSFIRWILLILVGSGILIGSFAGIFSAKKYLKV